MAAPEAPTKVATLDIHYAGQPKASLTPGEPFQVVIKPNQDAHVLCYFETEDGSIQRFFPNRFAPDSLITPKAPLTLPGSMPFKLFASASGNTERLACFSSPRPVMSKLPARVKGTDFENLPVQSLEQVQSTFEGIVGNDLGGRYFEITVR